MVKFDYAQAFLQVKKKKDTLEISWHFNKGILS